MKRFISILTLALVCATSIVAVAQDNKNDREKVRKERWEKFRQDKHDFYAQTMQLTQEQAAAFFPLFDEMEKKKFEAGREVRREARAIIKGENITDEQYKAAADRAAALHEKEVAIEKEYYERFCNILTPRQQFLYHRCDPEFQKQAIHKHQGGGKHHQQECKK